jgi:hypothetical protein
MEVKIENLTIEKKPLKEKDKYDKEKITFFGYENKPSWNAETKKYDKQEKKFLKFSLKCNQYNESLQQTTMSLSIGNQINVGGELFGGNELGVGNYGLFVKNFYAEITPSDIQIISQSNNQQTQEEEIIQDDEIPF